MSTIHKFNPIFVSHDTPRTIILNEYSTRMFFENFSKNIFDGIKPKAILVISAHWEENDFTIQTTKDPKVIYDFYNFPDEMYKFEYPAKTCPQLINRVIELFKDADIELKRDCKRGYDHGAWTVNKLIYPEADVPMVQISLKSNLNPTEHYQIGKALKPLVDEGYLVMGSGGTVHNLEASKDLSNHHDRAWAIDFEEWVHNTLTTKTGKEREDEFLKFESLPNSNKAHPTYDHFIPLFVILGCAKDHSVCKRIHCHWRNPVFCASSYSFE
ncbi:hypothetical protein DICPUDRAFT_78298 [Dictyostelium purpureum]|uniref:Extradiol ring-cleavage dioxygenase class III enzyme subunit B domain-containing protein n=1 Tax=Dictyostelium purpureum TaxID=5786 RepID=F0ZJ53_DICPU|nr:uncharacterized protein DICPUDRAFT_78298 [Dictyostelium purpureum]EGC36006.1 hypothetical protein DICPUDRAFT_78298 [Dictyostelium purpureum]|eukprot:XP_003287444.1 hypothetical protein DICPUDRAFT_78298 [Dictyostelium purpureum]